MSDRHIEDLQRQSGCDDNATEEYCQYCLDVAEKHDAADRPVTAQLWRNEAASHGI